MNVAEFLNMNALAPALACILAIGVMFAAICCVFRPPQQLSSVKLLGSLMVLTLAFAANDEFTYPLAIFITATQMTNLNFLENLAALFTKDKNYWSSRARHRRHRQRQQTLQAQEKPVAAD